MAHYREEATPSAGRGEPRPAASRQPVTGRSDATGTDDARAGASPLRGDVQISSDLVCRGVYLCPGMGCLRAPPNSEQLPAARIAGPTSRSNSFPVENIPVGHVKAGI